MSAPGTIGVVRRILDGSLGDRRKGPSLAQAALGALRTLGRDGLIVPLVEALIEDALTQDALTQDVLVGGALAGGALSGQVPSAPSDTSAARAGLSYRHALGFEKLMLLVGWPDYMLRVHIWPPSAEGEREQAPEHIHNHRFAFGSAVLLGDLEMRLYEPDPGGELFSAYEERIGAEEWLMHPRGSARLRLRADLRLARGTEYCLEADTRHQIVRNPGVCTVTLFLETATERARTDVYGGPRTPAPATVPKHALSVADYVAALRELRSLLC
ncbi:hypothetical protein QMK19_19270 [Streptomyces sp. H10-C2]|uniref:hypothetical protein n=1 Tax=unclassified Streptomyces TaxID=2593676 RepID=UPI0024B925BA|nr:MULTISPECIES: hypothetical protein [unclassified Streptomyces]MDJ0346247.1 hypothetical protein [Streptomyces sp. PH10-H1]MDJ0371762.1 hypothetical protein [Streptomyces sp. H10-C2]